MNDVDKELLALKQEQIRIEKARLQLALYQYEMQRRAYQRANRSWYEKLEDAIFDW